MRCGVIRVAFVVQLGLAAACTTPRSGPLPPVPESRVIQCTVSRQECIEEDSVSSCKTFSAVTSFTATTCSPPSDGGDYDAICRNAFCAQPKEAAYPYPSGCDARGANVTAQLSPSGVGICSPQNSTRESLIGVTRRWRDCIASPGGAFCSSLNQNGNMETGCFDVTNVRALDALQRPDGRDRSILISTYQANSPNCAALGSSSSSLIADVTQGNIGTVSAAGASATLTVVNGFALGTQNCSEGCVTSVNRLLIHLADRTVLGNQITGVTISSIRPFSFSGVPDPDSGLSTVAADAINLVATGRINGVDSVAVFRNTTPWRAQLTASSFQLQGSLDVLSKDAAGALLRVAVPISVSGGAAGQGTVNCVNLTPVSRIFGFEDPTSWTSTNASLSLVTSPITQGCGALGITGQGYMPIVGSAFSTADLVVNAAASVDLFIPTNQPNPSWLGALQMYLTCPSANVVNQFVGQVELTGKPTNTFSTVRFPLPAQTASALTQLPARQCSFSLALNVNQTGQPWILDNLRFTP